MPYLLCTNKILTSLGVTDVIWDTFIGTFDFNVPSLSQNLDADFRQKIIKMIIKIPPDTSYLAVLTVRPLFGN